MRIRIHRRHKPTPSTWITLSVPWAVLGENERPPAVQRQRRRSKSIAGPSPSRRPSLTHLDIPAIFSCLRSTINCCINSLIPGGRKKKPSRLAVIGSEHGPENTTPNSLLDLVPIRTSAKPAENSLFRISLSENNRISTVEPWPPWNDN